MKTDEGRNLYKSVLLKCLVGKFSLGILMRLRPESSIKPFYTILTTFGYATTSLSRKILQNLFPVSSVMDLHDVDADPEPDPSFHIKA
jgi:hypothetical protein